MCFAGWGQPLSCEGLSRNLGHHLPVVPNKMEAPAADPGAGEGQFKLTAASAMRAAGDCCSKLNLASNFYCSVAQSSLSVGFWSVQQTLNMAQLQLDFLREEK